MVKGKKTDLLSTVLFGAFVLLFGIIIGTIYGAYDAECDCPVCPTEEELCDLDTPELVYMVPKDCISCDNVTDYIKSSAEKVGLRFRQVNIDISDNDPGMFILAQDQMTIGETVASKEAVDGVMCISWEIEEMCTPELKQKYQEYLEFVNKTQNGGNGGNNT